MNYFQRWNLPSPVHSSEVALFPYRQIACIFMCQSICVTFDIFPLNMFFINVSLCTKMLYNFWYVRNSKTKRLHVKIDGYQYRDIKLNSSIQFAHIRRHKRQNTDNLL